LQWNGILVEFYRVRDVDFVKQAFAHIVTDLYGFIGTLVAGLVIIFTGFERAASIASLTVVGLMLHAAWGLLRETGRRGA